MSKLSQWWSNRGFNRAADTLISIVRDRPTSEIFSRDFEIIDNPGEVWTITVQRRALPNDPT